MPNLIVFQDGSSELETINMRTRSVNTIGAPDDFDISPDRRWIAWSQAGGEFHPDLDAASRVGIMATSGGNCMEVPRPANRQDTGAFFKPGVKRLFFLRGAYDPMSGMVASSRTISVPLSSLRRCT